MTHHSGSCLTVSVARRTRQAKVFGPRHIASALAGSNVVLSMPARTQRTTAPITEARTVLSGVRTRTLSVDGDGPAILLVHGFTDSADSWRPLLAELGALRRRAIAVDLPASGRADPLPGGMRLARLDRFIAAFADAYSDDRPAVLAGNSLGGLLAMRAATGDVALSAIAPIGTAGLAYSARMVLFERSVRRLAPLLWPLYHAPVPGWLVRRSAAWLYDARLAQGVADPALGRYYASHVNGMAGIRRNGATLLTVAEDDRREPVVLADIRVPVLLIWGARDHLASLSGADAVLNALPASRLVVFDDCGHCPQVQRPADIAALLADLPASADRAR